MPYHYGGRTYLSLFGDDDDALKFALEETGGEIVFSSGKIYNFYTSHTLIELSNIVLDLNNCVIHYLGTGTFLNLVGCHNITIKNGIVNGNGNDTSIGTNHFLNTKGTTLAQNWPDGQNPPQAQWCTNINLDFLSINFFATAFHFDNFSREIWLYRSIASGNLFGAKITGKVVNLYLSSTTLYSGKAGSKAASITGPGYTSLNRYPEGVQIKNCILDVLDDALTITDGYFITVTESQIQCRAIKDPLNTTNKALKVKKGSTPLTHSIFISGCIISGYGVEVGDATGPVYKYLMQLSNCIFDSIYQTNIIFKETAAYVSIMNCQFINLCEYPEFDIHYSAIELTGNTSILIDTISTDISSLNAIVSNNINTSCTFSNIKHSGNSDAFSFQHSMLADGIPTASENDYKAVGNYFKDIAPYNPFRYGDSIVILNELELSSGARGFITINFKPIDVQFTVELELILPFGFMVPSGNGWSAKYFMIDTLAFQSISIPFRLESNITSTTTPSLELRLSNNSSSNALLEVFYHGFMSLNVV